jgi:type II restriction enzyme
MDIRCDVSVAAGYKSGSQIARCITEHWCGRELYCAACSSDQLQPTARNTPSTDFICPQCMARYQVKSSSYPTKNRIVDAAYGAMIRAIRESATPHLVVLHYTATWTIHNALLVPAFFLAESTIEPRKPLAKTARRAGWIGCNILLSEIPPNGKISLVANGQPIPPITVRSRFSSICGLGTMSPERRGWLVDVLRIVDRIASREFRLADVYRYECKLASLHPSNRNIKAKIRQQLQVLRDLGILQFLGDGRYQRRQGTKPHEGDNH